MATQTQEDMLRDEEEKRKLWIAINKIGDNLNGLLYYGNDYSTSTLKDRLKQIKLEAERALK